MIKNSYASSKSNIPAESDGIKVLGPSEIKGIVDIHNPQIKPESNKELYTSLAIPSTINTASVGMTYIQEWFFSKIKKDFFRTFFVDGEDPIKAFKNFSINKDFKKVKPYLAIRTQYNMGYNRDMVDTYLWGVDNYLRHTSWNRTFLNDPLNNIYLSFTAELFEISYTFSLVVGTRAMQLDLYKYMQMAYRQNSTQGEFIDMDMIVPYDLMMKLATDIGFQVTDGKVENIIDFMKYLNKHSMLTFSYKFRGLTGKEEFYIRVPEVYMHISNLDDISIDDGENVGMTKDNFEIDMQVTLKMPSPKFYVYFSKSKSETIYPTGGTDGDAFVAGIYTIYKPILDGVNEKGWVLELSTEWSYEKDSVVDKNHVTIDFSRILINTYIWDIIKYNNDIYTSSEVFIDFQLLYDGKKLNYTMDWYTLIMTVEFPEAEIYDRNIFIAIYINNTYVNEVKTIINKINSTRMIASPNRFQG